MDQQDRLAPWEVQISTATCSFSGSQLAQADEQAPHHRKRNTALGKRGDSRSAWGGWQGSTWGNQVTPQPLAHSRALCSSYGPLHAGKWEERIPQAPVNSTMAGQQPPAATKESISAQTRNVRSSSGIGSLGKLKAKSSPDARSAF